MFNSSNLKEYKKLYIENGFFIVKNGFSLNQINCMRKRLDQIIEGSITCKGRRFQEETASGRYEDVSKTIVGYKGGNTKYRKISDLEYDEIFLKSLQSSWIRTICNYFIGETTSLMRVTMMNKPPFSGTELPWHQDVSKYWPTLIQPKMAIWFSLDPLSKISGSLQVIPSSHKHGVIKDGHMLDEEDTKKYAPSKKILTIKINVRDVLFFDSKLLHRSGTNKTQSNRRAINGIFLPGVVKHTISKLNYPIIFGENELNPSKVAKLKSIPNLNS